MVLLGGMNLQPVVQGLAKCANDGFQCFVQILANVTNRGNVGRHVTHCVKTHNRRNVMIGPEFWQNLQCWIWRLNLDKGACCLLADQGPEWEIGIQLTISPQKYHL